MDFVQDYIGIGLNGLTDFIIPFLIVLSVLVFVHEWGHYIVARLCGVRVEKFSIGFGKELFGFTDKAGTRWKFCLIPLGGYVQMFGDEDPASAKSSDKVKDDQDSRSMTNEEKEVAFFSKPVWQRASIVFAGPAVNFIFAVILLVGLYTYIGKPVNPPVASAVFVGGAAEEAGIKPHDRIIKINGDHIESFADIQRKVAISLDQPLEFTVLRDNKEVLVNITPQRRTLEDRFGFSHSRGMIGVMGTEKGIDPSSVKTINGVNLETLSDNRQSRLLNSIVGQEAKIGLPEGEGVKEMIVKITRIQDDEVLGRQIYLSELSSREIVHYGLFGSIVAAFKEVHFIINGTLEAIGQIITGTRSATELGGIVRIGAIAGDAAQNGLIALISFTALLSINLGLLNLFPIPLLDGGHLVFYAYEAIFGKPMSEKVMEYAFKFGMVFLIGLMAFANINDIVQMIL